MKREEWALNNDLKPREHQTKCNTCKPVSPSNISTKEKRWEERKAVNLEDLLVQVQRAAIILKEYVPSDWFNLLEDEGEEEG